ncbi:MAG: hypothetical protein LBT40_15640 [Deltaproteobacteria bacterium]|nr:hypothetical protein [Deltaproteobacteria bacterium]
MSARSSQERPLPLTAARAGARTLRASPVPPSAGGAPPRHATAPARVTGTSRPRVTAPARAAVPAQALSTVAAPAAASFLALAAALLSPAAIAAQDLDPAVFEGQPPVTEKEVPAAVEYLLTSAGGGPTEAELRSIVRRHGISEERLTVVTAKVMAAVIMLAPGGRTRDGTAELMGTPLAVPSDAELAVIRPFMGILGPAAAPAGDAAAGTRENGGGGTDTSARGGDGKDASAASAGSATPPAGSGGRGKAPSVNAKANADAKAAPGNGSDAKAPAGHAARGGQ